MVKIALQIKAQGEAVKSITAPGEDFRWHVKLKNGGSETGVVYISQENIVEVKGNRSHAHHVQKIGGKDCSVSILPEQIKSYEFVDENDEEMTGWQTICAFECRGCEMFEFVFENGWNVKSTSKTDFEDVDLSDDWYEVDDNGEPVSITELEWQFVKIK